MTLTDFLLARIAEDEGEARRAAADAMVGAHWKHYPAEAYEELQTLTLKQARRGLAECEAKRRIVEYAAPLVHTEYDDTARHLSHVLGCLTLPYADHPDYLEEWRP